MVNLILKFLPILISLSIGLMPTPIYMDSGSFRYYLQNKCDLIVEKKDFPKHIQSLIEYFEDMLKKQSKCGRITEKTYALRLSIFLDNQDQIYYVTKIEQESYNLRIGDKFEARIIAQNHWGLARAFETLAQLLENDFLDLPINLNDNPGYIHRGIMVDTARNYLSIDVLKRTIDSLFINKMNVLHWHITDDESFPLLLQNYSIITHSTKYSDQQIYTREQVQDLIEYASIRGVSIIPEIDAPAHTFSWGRNIETTLTVLECSPTIGQLDPTIDQTYELLTSIFSEIAEIFSKVQYIHFGGDEPDMKCYEDRANIQEYMKKNNMTNSIDLLVYFRKKQKQIWRKVIKSNQKIIYWHNKQETLPTDDDDIIQWWGLKNDIDRIAHRKNDFILSYYHPLYIDIGVGNAFGDKYETYQTWKDIYRVNLEPSNNLKGKVLGAELPLWGETNNEYTHFAKLYPRTSVLADMQQKYQLRLWNPQIRSNEELFQFAVRLGIMENRLVAQGFSVSPFTSQYCKYYVTSCFPKLEAETNQDQSCDLVKQTPKISLFGGYVKHLILIFYFIM